jgi:hypothetical protein
MIQIRKCILILFLLGVWDISIAQFRINTNSKTGAVIKIGNPLDKHQMNFVFASGDTNYKWQKPEEDWGLGKYDVADMGVKGESWGTAIKQSISGSKTILQYKTKCLDVEVWRQPAGKDFIETYTFKNSTGKKIIVSGLDIYTPYNDSYPDAKTAATNRCNAHIWPGMHSSYVNAVRMNGEGPHLGLVFTQGAMATYAITNRDRHKNIPWTYTGSNIRGVIVFNIETFVLQPGQTYTVQWKLFWHNGWNDFYKKAIAAGFVKLDADSYTISQGEKLNITIEANAAAAIKNQRVIINGYDAGEHSYKLIYNKGKKYTYLNYYVISSVKNIIDKRVQFIVDKQQMNKPEDGRNGAYMVYDNEADSIFTNPKLSVAPSDKDEGRERLGMGVLVAKWLQTNDNAKVRLSFMRYVKFIREKLQTPDYTVFSTIDHKSRRRGYNYPWVAHLYLETFKLTKDKQYLLDFFGTLNKYFREFGYEHYSIDFRVKDGLAALADAGMKNERDSLLDAYTKSADFFVKTGIYYPKHEVNYEQSIVAPAVTFLCEMYQVTKDKKYLDAAKIQLQSLEAFNGKQPDVHLNEIAIRHWDGYWFGKKEFWGDVMPHYWSALTAVAFHQYYLCTADAAYETRAKKILENNLLNFKEDGKASCAYIYPAFINNKPAKFYDAFANDQDWALVFYKEILDK